MKLLHLSGRKTCDYVLRKGTLWRGRTMNVRYLPGVPPGTWQRLKGRSPQGLYIGTFASLSLSKRAVDRNRMRRRCREALRITLQKEIAFPAFQLLVSPRSSSLSCDFRAIVTDVRSFLTLLRSCPKPPASAAPSSNSR
ncbi:MAG: ribonuclease P protein component [Candidatus Peribacteraceae bacterium]|jgi:ribonuclease P protein component|nr:ribonuclease P protein component [Candidatus Peribacteraceae bacterium]